MESSPSFWSFFGLHGWNSSARLYPLSLSASPSLVDRLSPWFLPEGCVPYPRSVNEINQTPLSVYSSPSRTLYERLRQVYLFTFPFLPSISFPFFFSFSFLGVVVVVVVLGSNLGKQFTTELHPQRASPHDALPLVPASFII